MTEPRNHSVRPLILASSSPRRTALLNGLGLTFEVVPSHEDESIDLAWDSARIVETLARRKARAVAERVPRDGRPLVIGADTIVVLDDAVLGKPKDVEDAKRMLNGLQGRSHDVFTGLCIVDVASGEFRVSHSRTCVTMRKMTADQIQRYVDTEEPLDKAGSYAIQGIGATLVTGISGDYFTVVGLPLSLLADMLAEFDCSVL